MYRDIIQEEIKLDKTLGYSYFTDVNHPLATGNSGRVYLHRHIKSIELGRWLTSKEIVHHNDENKTNNLTSNLVVLSQEEHAHIHTKKLVDKICTHCKKMYSPKKETQKFCSRDCTTSHSAVNLDITLDDIIYWVKTYSWVRAAKELGLSDNGLRKRYKKLSGLDPKLIRN